MIQLSERFVPIKLDAEKEGQAAAKKHDVEGYPTILFVTGDGEVVSRFSGFLPPREFMGAMQRILDARQNVPKWEATIKTTPNDVRAISGLGIAYAMKNDWKAAMELADRAMSVDPKNADDKFTDMYNAVGDMFQSAGKPYVAMEYFNRAAASGKDAGKVVYALIRMSACYLQLGMPSEAMAMADKAGAVPGIGESDKTTVESLKKSAQRMMDAIKATPKKP